MALTEYLWMAVIGGILGFAYGFLIGANDVANAFASSVASKSITLKQAVLIASVCEFGGAIGLGAAVTSTIRSKIVDTSLYEDEPEVLMFGMLSALVSANLMLWIATHMGLPVSTTHDIVGSIMGFSLAAKGFDSIEWDVAKKIWISWIISPLLSGSVAAIMFAAVKYLVLRSEKPYERAYWTFPIVLTIGIGINLFYVLFKGTSNKKDFNESLKWYVVLPISLVVGFCCGLVWLFVVGPFFKKQVEAKRAAIAESSLTDTIKDTPDGSDGGEGEKGDTITDDDCQEIDVDDLIDKMKNGATAEEVFESYAKVTMHARDDIQVIKAPEVGQTILVIDNNAIAEPTKPKGLWAQFAQNTFDQNLEEQALVEGSRTAEVWNNAEKFDEDAENMFSYVQVFTACLNSFAHGANDVSNTIAPLSAIIQIYQDGAVDSKATVQKWVLAYGGFAIVLGLLLYGYRVMKSVGYKLTHLSPSRGFVAELAASLVVVTASFNEIPVSSTQCIVGAISGVGLVGGVKNVQWLFLLKVCFGWVILYFAAVLFSAGVFSFAYYSPSN